MAIIFFSFFFLSRKKERHDDVNEVTQLRRPTSKGKGKLSNRCLYKKWESAELFFIDVGIDWRQEQEIREKEKKRLPDIRNKKYERHTIHSILKRGMIISILNLAYAKGQTFIVL